MINYHRRQPLQPSQLQPSTNIQLDMRFSTHPQIWLHHTDHLLTRVLTSVQVKYLVTVTHLVQQMELQLEQQQSKHGKIAMINSRKTWIPTSITTSFTINHSSICSSKIIMTILEHKELQDKRLPKLN